jgi:hypothetical protein
MSNERQKKVLDKDGLTMENIIVKELFNKNSVKYLSEKESDDLFFGGQTSVDEFDWSFSWENVIHGQSASSFTAPVNGWFSIDTISGTEGVVKVNDSLGITIQNTGSFQTMLKSGDVVSCSGTTFNYSFVPCNGEITD